MSEIAALSDQDLLQEVGRRAQEKPGFREQLAALVTDEARPGLTDALAGGGEAPAESPLARFETQYKTLPQGNILAQGSTWGAVQARLLQPENADKLAKVLQEMDEPRLYTVMEDGSCEFVDGNPDTPPMFVKDNKTGQFQIIFRRNDQQMKAARAQIAQGTHQWATIQEMLDWAEAKGFEVFEADDNDPDGRSFGELIKLAGAASATGQFVGKSKGPWMGTALKNARCAGFFPGEERVYVDSPRPRFRDDSVGLLRRLRV